MTPLVLPEELTTSRSVLVMAPHQDDEVLGCGNLMRAFSKLGVPLAIAWLTDGGYAFGPISQAARLLLAADRANEAIAGAQSMDIVFDRYFFGYPDGALDEHVEAAADRLRTLVRERAVDVVFVTDGADGHPDHRTAFEIAHQIPGPAIYSYPVSARYDGEDIAAGRDAVTLDADNGHAKRKALACHVSQHEGGKALYPLTVAAMDRFCAAPETFYRIRNKQS